MYMLSVFDVIKKSVINEFSGTISVDQMLLSLIIAFVIGLFIVFVYRKTYTGVVYSKSFSLCIILLAMVTAMIIRTINSNLALSLGMVGALSIVRFRTAVKEPVDTGFMFWGISVGIMTGAGLYLPAIVASLCLGLLYFGSYLLGFKVLNRYLLVIKYKSSSHDEVLGKLKKLKKFKIRSKSIFGNEVELSIEVNIKEDKNNINTSAVDQFQEVNGVVNASLISYRNDFGE